MLSCGANTQWAGLSDSSHLVLELNFFSSVTVESPDENLIWCTPGGHALSLGHKQRVLDQIKNGWVDDVSEGLLGRLVSTCWRLID